MGRTLFSLSIALNSGIISLIAAGILVTYVFADYPEAGEGWGLLWATSVPAIILLSAAALVFYPTYVSASTAARRLTIYLTLVLIVSGLAPALTLAIVRALSWTAAGFRQSSGFSRHGSW